VIDGLAAALLLMLEGTSLLMIECGSESLELGRLEVLGCISKL
jgi:hypothetical protein